MSGKQLKTNLSSLQGEISIPGDKSIFTEPVMFGAMAEGKTTINHFLAGEDCLSTISCFEKDGRID